MRKSKYRFCVICGAVSIMCKTLAEATREAKKFNREPFLDLITVYNEKTKKWDSATSRKELL